MADPYAYIGFAQKARKCISGFQGVMGAVKGQKVSLVVGDDLLTQNTRKKLENACSKNHIPILYLREPGRAAGKEAAMCLAIMDAQLAKAIIESQRQM